MRAPPPVQFPCGPDAPWRLGEALLAALAAAAATGVAISHTGDRLPAFAATVGIPALAALGVAAVWWRRQSMRPAVQLQWDGQVWRADDQAIGLSCVLDLGRWMVLQLEGPHGRRRVVTALPPSPPARHAVRVAVLQHRRHDAQAAHG